MARYTNRKLKDLRDNPNDLPWDDLRIAPSNVRLPTANAPSPEDFRGGKVLGFEVGESVYFETQLPHAWAEETQIMFHIHWAVSAAGAGAGAENVQWQFTYSWANIGDIFPAATTATLEVDVQDAAQYEQLINGVADIDAKDKRASSVLICSLSRIAASGSEYSGLGLILSMDFHWQSDSNGSYHEFFKLRGDYEKQKGTPKKPFKPGAW